MEIDAVSIEMLQGKGALVRYQGPREIQLYKHYGLSEVTLYLPL